MGERLLIILDTHIFLWLTLNPDRISPKQRAAIQGADTLGISAISLWEIAMLVQKGRINLPQAVLPWFEEVLSSKRFAILPITSEIAARSGELAIHGDPADRLIAATAIAGSCPLITSDSILTSITSLLTI
jgi:PIN domain nuclease of toxin-antitoxin system